MRWRDILDDKRLATAHPLLKAAVSHVAHYQIRNRGTVGGSLAHADPAAEMPGIARPATRKSPSIGKAGARTIKAADFFLGALTTALEPDEIITEIHLPAWPASAALGLPGVRAPPRRFRHGRHRAVSTMSTGGKATNAHIGVIGVGDQQRRLPKAEAALNGKAVDEALAVKVGEAAVGRGRAAGRHPRQRGLSPLAHRHADRARAACRGGEDVRWQASPRSSPPRRGTNRTRITGLPLAPE